MAQGQAAACLAEPPMSNELTNAPLERRIAAALTDDVWSADLSTLIAETEAAIVDADRNALDGNEVRSEAERLRMLVADQLAGRVIERPDEVELEVLLMPTQQTLVVVGQIRERPDGLPVGRHEEGRLVQVGLEIDDGKDLQDHLSTWW